MLDPFIGELSFSGYNYAPEGWALCLGQSVQTSQNQALYALIGTLYGGTATAFCLPDLRGRVVVGYDPSFPNYACAKKGGVVNTTLSLDNMPTHTHSGVLVNASVTVKAYSGVGTAQAPGGRANATVLSGSSVSNTYIYGTTAPDTVLNVGGGPATGTVTVGVAGSSLPFSNMQPYLAMGISIALQGIFPVRS